MRRFAEIDSTNRYLLDEARAGAPEGVVAVTDHQTAGRGRLGRTWSAPAGSSLLMSVLLRPSLPIDRAHLAAAAVALAAREACEKEAGVGPDLKWPNDLMVEGRKLGGVLAEADLPAVVVGLGLNVTWAPPAARSGEAAALSQVAGRPVRTASLLDRLLDSLGSLVSDWATVASRYRRSCATVGRRVRVELAGETIIGTATDVSDDGHLKVEAGGRLVTITAADVVHLRTDSPGASS